MMINRRNSIAIEAQLTWLCLVTLLLASFLATGSAFAQTVGTVTNLSGPLIARKADGVVKVLSQQSTVESGDILESAKNTYARIKFIDDSEVMLRPDSQFKIESFSFDEAKPDGDSSVFSLIKGGLRSITGLLGKRNKEKFKLTTPTATIGIRGTNFGALYCQSDCGSVPTTSGSAPQNGLYVDVSEGQIVVANTGGQQAFTAGQFGFVANLNTPPVILPTNPGIQFTPPPSFSQPEPGGSAPAGKPGDVDCQVR